MGRKKLLGDAVIKWAHAERCRGCKMDAVAAMLGVDRRTLQRLFKERGLHIPEPIPQDPPKKGPAEP